MPDPDMKNIATSQCGFEEADTNTRCLYSDLHKNATTLRAFCSVYWSILCLYFLEALARQMIFLIMPLRIMFVYGQASPGLYYALTMTIFTARVFWGMIIDMSGPIHGVRRRAHIIVGYTAAGLLYILLAYVPKTYNNFIVYATLQSFFFAWGTAARDGAVYENTGVNLTDNVHVQFGVQMAAWLGTGIGTIFDQYYKNIAPEAVIAGCSAFLFAGGVIGWWVPEKSVILVNSDAEVPTALDRKGRIRIVHKDDAGNIYIPARRLQRIKFLWRGLRQQCTARFWVLEWFIFLALSIPGCEKFEASYISRVFWETKFATRLIVLLAWGPLVGGLILWNLFFYLPKFRLRFTAFWCFVIIICISHLLNLVGSLIWLPILRVNETGGTKTSGTLFLCVLSVLLRGLSAGTQKVIIWIFAAMATSRIVPSSGHHVIWLLNDLGYEMQKEMARPFKLTTDIPERRIRIYLLHIYAMLVVPLFFLPCVKLGQDWHDAPIDEFDSDATNDDASGKEASKKNMWKKMIDF